MKAVRQHIHGTLFTEDGRIALLLKDASPTAATADSLYLRYAFVVQGIEEHILPAFILDDWGGEIKSLELYEWVRQFGHQFPRAELFGLDANGRERQHFLRELELYVKLPCYVYATQDAALVDGMLVEAILLPDAGVSSPQKIKRPLTIARPLRSAKVSWWRINPAITTFGLSLERLEIF